MRLWTSQDVGFYEDLMSNGIAYCNKVSDFAKDNGIAYQWMVEQRHEGRDMRDWHLFHGRVGA